MNADATPVWEALAGICDPEIPALPITDLGIVRDVDVASDAQGRVEVTVTITPTYSGCPAMDVIEQAIGDTLGRSYDRVRVVTRLTPAWTTDWISERGLELLHGSGIAPPREPVEVPEAVAGASFRPLGTFGAGAGPAAALPGPACPHCGAADAEQLSAFGSTACKSLWRCRSCREPFDHFKPHRAPGARE